jgi:hypothetical protein
MPPQPEHIATPRSNRTCRRRWRPRPHFHPRARSSLHRRAPPTRVSLCCRCGGRRPTLHRCPGHAYVHMCMCTCVCVCVYAYTHSAHHDTLLVQPLTIDPAAPALPSPLSPSPLSPSAFGSTAAHGGSPFDHQPHVACSCRNCNVCGAGSPKLRSLLDEHCHTDTLAHAARVTPAAQVLQGGVVVAVV